jgi:hypothetical protein
VEGRSGAAARTTSSSADVCTTPIGRTKAEAITRSV